MRSHLAIALIFLLGPASWSSADDRVFQAGASTVNITPPLGEMIVGNWVPLPADDVHDELHARCLVLDDGEQRLAIVICDNVGVPREVFDDARHRITETTGIPASHQLMAATHTHSATTARSNNALVPDPAFTDYQSFLSRRISDAVRLAIKRLQPARIGWGSVDEPSQVFNRRWYVEQEEERRNPFGGIDQVRMNPGGSALLIRPAGPIDPEVSVLSVQTAEGQPLAVLANYSLHYVGGVPARTISADYFAVFADHLTELLEQDSRDSTFVAMLSNGTSGDVNNINFRERSPARAPFEKMREVGELVAQRVHQTLEAIEYQDDVTLSAAHTELELAVRKPDAKLLESMRQRRDQPEGSVQYYPHELTYTQRLEDLAVSPDRVSVPLQAIRIGTLAISAIPFEVFAEIGLELKERTPFEETFTIELANGSYGYLPSPAQHELGGYETWMGTNRVEVEASDKIVKSLLQMHQELKDVATEINAPRR